MRAGAAVTGWRDGRFAINEGANKFLAGGSEVNRRATSRSADRSAGPRRRRSLVLLRRAGRPFRRAPRSEPRRPASPQPGDGLRMEFWVDVAIAVVCPAGELHHGEVGHFVFVIELEKLGEPLAGGLAGDDRVERSIERRSSADRPKVQSARHECFPSFAAGPVRRACRPIRSSRRRGATRAIPATARSRPLRASRRAELAPRPLPVAALANHRRSDPSSGSTSSCCCPAAGPAPILRQRIHHSARHIAAAWTRFPWSNRQVSATRANHPSPSRSRAAGRTRAGSSQRASCSALRRRPASVSISVSQIRRKSDGGQSRRFTVDGGGQPLHQSRGRRAPGPRAATSPANASRLRSRRTPRQSPAARPRLDARRRRSAWPSARRMEPPAARPPIWLHQRSSVPISVSFPWSVTWVVSADFFGFGARCGSAATASSARDRRPPVRPPRRSDGCSRRRAETPPAGRRSGPWGGWARWISSPGSTPAGIRQTADGGRLSTPMKYDLARPAEIRSPRPRRTIP